MIKELGILIRKEKMRRREGTDEGRKEGREGGKREKQFFQLT
jgi:hypothetical protein